MTRLSAFASTLVLLVLLGCGAGGLSTANLALIDNVSFGLSGGDFCCDPKKQPQVIATVRVSNKSEVVDIIVRIGPFTQGVRTEDGDMTSRTLRPGEVLDTKILSTRCDWTTTEGKLVITGPGDSVPGVVETTETVERNIALENKCPEKKVGIQTSVKISGLARAHFDIQNDPPTTGMHPLLYAIGPDTANAIEVFAIEVDATTKKITNTPREGSIMIPSQGEEDLVPVSAGTGPGLKRALYTFGPNSGYGRTFWSGSGWGIVRVLNSPVRDLVSYGGSSRAPGVSYVRGSTVFFEEYDPATTLFNGTGFPLGGEVHFPNKTGDPVSAFVDPVGKGVIVVLDGSPGQVWFHERSDFVKPASLVGVAGNDARQVRAKNGLAAISNHGSNTITILKWDGSTKPVIVPPALSLGPNALKQPRAMDMIVLENGNTALVVASDATHHWWIGEFNANGGIENQWEGNNGGTVGLADIVFLPGPVTYLAMALKGSMDVRLVETALMAPPQ